MTNNIFHQKEYFFLAETSSCEEEFALSFLTKLKAKEKKDVLIQKKFHQILFYFRTKMKWKIRYFFLRIRYFDVSILVANVLFLLFILIRWIRSRTKLNPSKPLLFSVSCLILAISLVNILRCSLSMVFSNRTLVVHEILFKVNREIFVKIHRFSFVSRHCGYSFDWLFSQPNWVFCSLDFVLVRKS